MLACLTSKVLLQAQLAQLQVERDRLDSRATVAERDYAAASSELEETKLNLKVKLEEQQNQFRAIEEEQYSDWEKRVNLTHTCSDTCHNAAVLVPSSRSRLLASVTGLG